MSRKDCADGKKHAMTQATASVAASTSSVPAPAYGLLWRSLDVAIAGVLVAVTFPAYFLIPPLHRFISREPAMFEQERVGIVRDSARHIFRIKKFCTFHSDIDEKMLGKKKGITRLGLVLRPCGLDEIPQLRQVLSGEMSIFGPRPFSLEDYDLIENRAQNPAVWERTRDVVPGILSPGGILVRHMTSQEHIAERVNIDLAYRQKLVSARFRDQFSARAETLWCLLIHGPSMILRARGK